MIVPGKKGQEEKEMITGLTMQVIQAGIPVEAGPWYAQANEHMNSGNFDLAVELYDKVIELSPHVPWPITTRVTALTGLGNQAMQ